MRYKSSITHRFLMYLIGIIVISNLMVFVCHYLITEHNMTRQSIDMSWDLMDSNLITMERYFEDIDKISDSIIYNDEINKFLKSKQDKASSLEFLNGVQSLYYSSRPDLHIILYKANDYYNMYSIILEERNIAIQDYRSSDWYQQLLEKDTDKVVITNNTDEISKEFVHSVIYPIEDFYSDEVVGYLRIDMDLNSLKDRLVHEFSKLAGTSIYDADGKLLFYDKMIVPLPEDFTTLKITGTYEKSDYIMTYGVSENTGWYNCIAMSKQEILKNQKSMIHILIVVLTLIIALTILISNRIFSIITVNFTRLVDGMNSVKQGNLMTQVEIDTSDEISFLIMEFNEMVKKVDELVKMVGSKQILLKEAEIKALQQQINPHFIHNIMETIMGLASEGMSNEVITVSKCMSAMLRYNTNLKNITEIREEIKQIQNYVQVFKIRFENRFEVFYDIDEACMDYNIVKFTLQPLVENALSHGFRNTNEDGMLRIRIKEEGKHVSIMIFDNGTGISEEQLTELNQRFKETWSHPLDYIDQYKSLGLLNVHLRLRLYYGDDYAIEIFSKDGRGTCISIKIPAILEKSEISESSVNY